jgi:3,4-dihydroxy 2-butanone 4-phosphate synthase/GTP cyclohydrolase II
VRVHQPVSILDLLEAGATTHSWNLAAAMRPGGAKRRDRAAQLRRIAEQMFDQFGALNKVGTPARQAARADRMDLRTYGIGAQILREVGVCKMKLLASPRKMPSMTGFQLK